MLTYIRARLFNSTDSIAKLVAAHPQKKYPFAIKILEAKQSRIQLALNKRYRDASYKISLEEKSQRCRQLLRSLSTESLNTDTQPILRSRPTPESLKKSALRYFIPSDPNKRMARSIIAVTPLADTIKQNEEKMPAPIAEGFAESLLKEWDRRASMLFPARQAPQPLDIVATRHADDAAQPEHFFIDESSSA